ncbi:uncharacterized protein A1O9_10100 [Exophiala aquamarina CBS 119918]|uniref:RBR-type E3 ubiquitin transferase n=1 Tax=Exophiala aquamarina CBS 119918 TaxID=1182545 RepID=A0A072PDR4_9EURO|nr:uncharacterized protein A1O9_10100 [Exophiala aquamarina CBS 119918]KEF53700.1 hypothetical protein A1O9_10100 [Exophiala aquamarina CBS 119918]
MSDETTVTVRPEDPFAPQPWEAFKTGYKLYAGHDWRQEKIPVELQTVPDDGESLEKLKQIIVWSLAQLPPPSATEIQNKAEADINKSSTNKCGAGSDTPTGQLLVPDFTKVEDVASSLTPSPTRIAERPSALQKRRPNARHYSISQGLFASTIDLLATLKPKLDKDSTAQDSFNAEPQVECVSCFEDFQASETPILPCSHPYCKTCLKELVLTALQTESSFPPKCCLTEIPLQTVLLPLNKKQREVYKETAAEYAVPAEDRWYCPNTKCLKWIPPKRTSRFMTVSHRCSHCSTKICVTCRGIAHRRSSDCPEDYGLEATLSLAEMQGWRRCFKCRALVERTEGCRHMACRCGSQFCYYCGSKWKTCKCTDYEGTQRIAERRRQIELRDAVAAAEAEEIARAVAEIEAMEQREAERLRAERRREEEELQRLEQLRVEEEGRKKAEKEAEEKEYRRMLRISVDEQLQGLRKAFSELMRSQQHALDNKHLLAEQAQKRAHEEYTAKQQKDSLDLVAKMEANIKRRTDSMGEKQKSELRAFEKEQEQAEDDMFLQIQLHLQGKPNKEFREQRLRDELNKQREQKLEAINKRFGSQTEALKQNAAMELNILKQASERRLAEIETRHDRELRSLAATVTTDRAWFYYLVERRQNMISANSRLMLEAVDSNQEVVGLTADGAMKIGPFAIPEHSPTSSVTESPSTSFVELAADSERLLNTLPSDDALGSGVAGLVSVNQAWDFMTLGSALGSTNFIPSGTTARNQQRSGLGRQAFPTARYAAYHGDYSMSGALSPLDEKSALSLSSYRGHSRQTLNEAPPPPVPSIPTLYLPNEALQAELAVGPNPQALQPSEAPQPQPQPHSTPQSTIEPRGLPQEDHKFIVIPSLSVHSRQSSSDSSGSMTNYSSSTSMSSLGSGSAALTGHQQIKTGSSSSVKPALEHQRSRMWSFRSLAGRTASDKYTEEEIRERMKRTVGDAFGT